MDSTGYRLRLTVTQWLLLGILFTAGLFFLSVSNLLPRDSTAAVILDLLGSFIVVAVPVELLREFLFSDAERRRQMALLGDLFDRKISTMLVNAKTYGLDRLVEAPNFKELFDKLDAGDTLWWLDTFAPGHKQWLDSVELALKRGACVKMLIIQPGSYTMTCRANEIGGHFTPQKFRYDLEGFIEDFVSCAETTAPSSPGSLEIRLYDNLPGCPAYIVERDKRPIYAYSSVFLTRPTGVAFPHFRWVNAEKSVLEILHAYVTKKFETALPWPPRKDQPNSPSA